MTSNVPFTQSDGSCTTTGTLYQNVWAQYNAQNQMTGTSAPGWSAAPSYDAAGDVSNDGRNAYLYDAEGRICAVNNGNVQIGYLYDAAGNRVAKGTISSWSCDITSNGFTQTAAYVVDGGGQQLSEVDGSSNWTHTNVWAAGKLIGTYDSAGLHFHFDDPLGTRRVQASAAGAIEATYQSLPYGDGFAASGSGNDPTENHFTGKERDAESGNDYMFARYYNSATGRFLSPDWDAKSSDPVPYAKLDDPQSLNLYGYVRNNPVGRVDADGHCAEDACVVEGTTAAVIFVGLTASAYLAMPSTQRSLNAAASSALSTIGGWFHKDSEEAPVPAATPAPSSENGTKTAPAAVPTEGVYEFPDKKAGGKTYVGQSGNIPSRLSQHEASGKKDATTPATTTEVQGGKTAREVAETGRIKELGGTSTKEGSQTSNKRLSVSDKRMEKIKNGSSD